MVDVLVCILGLDSEKIKMMYLHLFLFVKALKCAYVTLKLSLSCSAVTFCQGIFKGINHPC